MQSDTTTRTYDDTGKVVFDDVYNQPDPRSYFSSLSELDYRIAGEAQPVFEQTLAALRATRDVQDVKAVDLGCSYGINAALMKYDVDLDELNAHYGDEAIRDLDREEVIKRDVEFFRGHVGDPRIETVGIDTSRNAIDYALEAGLIDDGIVTNLEETTLSDRESGLLDGVDLVMSTGCIGYVSEESLAKLLDATSEERPWMAHSVLRMFPFAPYRELFDRHDYVTEQLDGTLLQRQFASTTEQEHVLENLAEVGVDPTGLESEGWYHANFYVCRPAEEATTPLDISI